MLIDELKLIIESIKKHIPKVISSFKLSDLENDLYEQPDWNQNDETALNYINNRTHYEESLLETIFDEEITVDTVYGGDGSEFIYYLPASVNLNLETGASYVITLGDQTEVGILDGAYLNTASWLFAPSRRALRGANAGEYKVPFTKRFTLSKIGESIVHQLDEKFIPETIARVSKLPQSDWNQSDETTTDYVKNRTHYTGLVDGNILVDNLNSADYENGVSIPQCRIIPGNTYKVIWNGEVYNNIVCVSLGGVFNLIGGDRLVGEESYPFTILNNLLRENVDELVIDGTTQQFTVSIIERVEVTKKLDEQYIPDTIARVSELPQSDWNQLDETSRDYILNKPFGEIASYCDTLTWYGSNSTDGLLCLYDVIYKISDAVPTIEDLVNGIVEDGYSLYSYDRLQKQYNSSGLIRTSYFTIIFTDNFKDPMSGDVYPEAGVYLYIEESDKNDHTLTIPGYNGFRITNTKKLDEKYIPDTIARIEDIPQSDWSQSNEAAADYVKNRTHYEENLLETIFDREVTVTYVDNDNQFSYTMDSLQLEDGTYAITFGNRTETGILGSGDVIDTGSWKLINHMRSSSIYGDNTGEYTVPFTKRLIISKVIETVVHQLDEKYIPDTIARVEDICSTLELITVDDIDAICGETSSYIA